MSKNLQDKIISIPEAVPEEVIPKRKLISAEKTAEMLNVSQSWVHYAMKRGTLPFKWYLIGYRHMCDFYEVEAYIESCAIMPAGKGR